MITTSARSDRLGLAIGVIFLTCFALSLGDAMIKGSAERFALWQMFILRSALALPVFAALMIAFVPRRAMWPKASGWVALRVGLLVIMWVFYYMSLPHLQLSVAAAAYYTLPIFMTAFSAVLLKERIGPIGWGAVALGFVGVVIILRPDAQGVNVYVLLPLFSAALYAVAMILTRTKCREEYPVTLGFYLALGFLLAGALAGAVLPTDAGWVQLETQDWYTMILLASALIIGAVGAAVAYQNAPPSVIGVFDFSYVGFAVVWGIVLFGETPDALTMLGIGIIVLAGGVAIWAKRIN